MSTRSSSATTYASIRPRPSSRPSKAVVLYAQNGMKMVKNAMWLALILWGVTFVIFLLMPAPAGAVLYLMPGQSSGWSVVLAIVFAWALKAASHEPFAIASLMQVYFRTIEGQVPDLGWDHRLTAASRRFRELKDKAVPSFGVRSAGPAPQSSI